MVANALVNLVPPLNLLHPNRLMPPADAFSPPKKKRGRPPKPNNFSNRITTTLNISVNTSPLSSSPNAENNSNQIVKRGVPDVFTPTMRVSPSTKARKRRKNSSISSIESISPSTGTRDRRQSSLHGSRTNSMSNSPTINSKALDNISMITNNQPIYNTPPPSAIRNVVRKAKDLLPSVVIETEKPVSPTNTSESHIQSVFEPNDDFSLKLMIDESGKAVLSSDFLAHSYDSSHFVGSHSDMSSGADGQFSRRAQSFQDIPKSVEPKPKLYHANSVIGLETPYYDNTATSTVSGSFYVPAHEKQSQNHAQVHQKQQEPQHPQQQHHQHQNPAEQQQMPESRPVAVKLNSENNWHPLSDVNPPQTPKFKENYLLAPTGLTPLSYNLTPQFNSMMYSIMDSPQLKKINNSQQFMFNQEFFVNPGANNVNMNDYMNMNGSTSTNTNLSAQMPSMSNALAGTGQNYSNPAPPYNASESFSPEDGDARLALKKKIYIRR